MTADALSSRLLEAIDKTEKAAHLTDAGIVPRLCQAHREIVEMYLAVDRRPTAGGMRDLQRASTNGKLVTLGLVLQALARAYGIEEDSSGHSE